MAVSSVNCYLVTSSSKPTYVGKRLWFQILLLIYYKLHMYNIIVLVYLAYSLALYMFWYYSLLSHISPSVERKFCGWAPVAGGLPHTNEVLIKRKFCGQFIFVQMRTQRQYYTLLMNSRVNSCCHIWYLQSKLYYDDDDWYGIITTAFLDNIIL